MTINTYTRAVVTGASRGIGMAVVEKLRRCELAVLAVSPDTHALMELQSRCHCDVASLDVRDAQQVSQWLSDYETDVLINCAAILGPNARIHEHGSDDVQTLMDINVNGLINCVRAVVPGMRSRQRGHIVNISSIAGHYSFDGEPVYAATKAAVHSLCGNLRMDLHGTHIRVSEIVPGRVASGMHAQFTDGNEARAEQLFYAGLRCLTPADIADAIHYVLSAPLHVDVTQLEIMPTDAVVGGHGFFRSE